MQLQLLNILHVLVAIAMIAFILVQRGPGATAGAAFGSGASGTVFGSRGAGSFLSRSTWVMATLFCLISLVMAVFVSRDLSTPDTDLGVVADTPAVTETVSPEPTMIDPDTDLPSLDTGIGEGGALERAPSDPQVQGNDLPAFDSAPADAGPGSAPGEDSNADGDADRDTDG